MSQVLSLTPSYYPKEYLLIEEIPKSTVKTSLIEPSSSVTKSIIEPYYLEPSVSLTKEYLKAALNCEHIDFIPL
jgi:hypothetical protein